MPNFENSLSNRYQTLGKLYQHYPNKVPVKNKYQIPPKAIAVCLGSYGLPFRNTYYSHKDDSALKIENISNYFSAEQGIDIINANFGYVQLSDDFSKQIGGIYQNATSRGQPISSLGLILVGHSAPFSIFGVNHNFTYLPYGLMWAKYQDITQNTLEEFTHPMFLRLDTGLFLYDTTSKETKCIISSNNKKLNQFDNMFNKHLLKNIYKQGYIRCLTRENLEDIQKLFPKLSLDISPKSFIDTPDDRMLHKELWAQEELDSAADIAKLIKNAEFNNGITFCNVFVYSCNSGTEIINPKYKEYIYSSVRFFSGFLTDHYILSTIGLNSDGKSKELYKQVSKPGQKKSEYQECAINLLDSMIIFKNLQVDATFTLDYFIHYSRLVGLTRTMSIDEPYLPISNGNVPDELVKRSMFSQIQMQAYEKTCHTHGISYKQRLVY